MYYCHGKQCVTVPVKQLNFTMVIIIVIIITKFQALKRSITNCDMPTCLTNGQITSSIRVLFTFCTCYVILVQLSSCLYEHLCFFFFFRFFCIALASFMRSKVLRVMTWDVALRRTVWHALSQSSYSLLKTLVLEMYLQLLTYISVCFSLIS